MDKIKAVIFDVGGVLRIRKGLRKHKHKSVHGYVAEKFGLTLDSWFDTIDNAYPKSMEGEISDKETVKILASNLKTTPTYLTNLFAKLYNKRLKKNKKLYRIAFKLKKKGVVIGILSDQWALSKPNLMPKKDIKDFNIVIVSSEVGMRKPSLKIYRLLMKKLKQKDKSIRYKDVLFIDNREFNLKPANKLGMKTILFKNNKQCIKELKMFKIF